ncbi:MAG: sigma-E processing peptidase SpoIIGA [Clostridia bacterium]|nr:sigma-E processing peptidase SpoIIGA [Clostridia bacterium]
MTVYADVAFSLNALIDYLILLAGAKLGGGLIRKKRLVLAAMFGGLYAAAALFPELEMLRKTMVRAVCCCFMLLIAFGSDERLLRKALCVLAVSFCFAGFVLCAVHLFGMGLLIMPTGAYYPVSLTSLLFLASAAYLTVSSLSKVIAKKLNRKTVQLKLLLDGEEASILALCDTGNTLVDPVSGGSVIVADLAVAEMLFPKQLGREDFSDPVALTQKLRKICPASAPRLIPYRAVGVGDGLLPAVRLKAVCNGICEDRLVAFSSTPVSDGSFDALIGGLH